MRMVARTSLALFLLVLLCVPAFASDAAKDLEATPQANTRFVLSPIGQTIVLPGSSGVMIRFTTLQMGAYVNLPKTLAGGGPLLLQVRNLEDFEGTVSFGAGLSAGGCASADVSGSTVTFHFLQTGKG